MVTMRLNVPSPDPEDLLDILDVDPRAGLAAIEPCLDRAIREIGDRAGILDALLHAGEMQEGARRELAPACDQLFMQRMIEFFERERGR